MLFKIVLFLISFVRYVITFELKLLNFFESLLKSEGVLSSLQFGFTSLLALLVPLLINLYEIHKDSKYELDQKNIQKLIDFKTLVWIVTAVVIFVFSMSSSKLLSPWVALLFIFILAILFGLLVHKIFVIADYLVNRTEQRHKFIKDNNSIEVLDFWEDYFVSLKKDDLVKLGSRKQQRLESEEYRTINLFFQKIESLDFKKDAEFAAQMINVLNQNLDNINLENFFSYSEIDTEDKRHITSLTIFSKILEWHYQSWEICTINKVRNCRELENKVSSLIGKILERVLSQDDSLDLISIKDDLESFLKKGSNKLNYYNNLIIFKTFFDNACKKVSELTRNEYFPDEWRFEENSSIIGDIWKESFWDWFLHKTRNIINLGDLTNLENQQIQAILEIFFRDFHFKWLGEILVYWLFNYNTTNRIAENLEIKLDFVPHSNNYTSKMPFAPSLSWEEYSKPHAIFDYAKAKEKIDDEAKKKTIKFAINLLGFEKTKLDEDLKEIGKLKNDETLDDDKKARLQKIKEIWEELRKEIGEEVNK